MKTLIAVDPGKSGGLAVFIDGKLAETRAFTGEADVLDLVSNIAIRARREGEDPAAVLEQVGGFIAGGEKRQPGSAMFNFGANYGFYRGVFAALRIPLVLVRPQVWQKGIAGVATLRGSDKKRGLREAAIRMYPHSAATLKTADAILIGDWFLRNGVK